MYMHVLLVCGTFYEPNFITVQYRLNKCTPLHDDQQRFKEIRV